MTNNVSPPGPIPKRSWLAFTILILVSLVISYADRTNMAIAIIPMGDEFSWSETVRGTVLGSFFVGYILTQILGGWLADHVYGGGLVLLFGVCAWSFCTLITPIAARTLGIAGIIVARIALGAAEGVGYPSVHSMLPARIPSRWMNATVAAVNSMVYAGGVVALLVSAPLAVRLGWPSIFYGFGGIGLLWIAPWTAYLALLDYTIPPERLHTDKPPNLPTILSPRHSRKVPWRKLLSKRPVWALFACYYCNAWGFWIILSWLPTLLRDRFNADLADLGWMSMMPYATQGIVGMLSGFLGDRILHRGTPPKRTFRLLAQGIAMLVPALLLICSLLVGKLTPAIVLVSAATAVNAVSTVGVGMNHFDLAPRHAGFLYGCLNSVGVVPGIVGVPLSGWMMARWGWWPVFLMVSLHYIVGFLVWFWFGAFQVQVE